MILSNGLLATDIAKLKKTFNLHPLIDQVTLYGSRAKGSYKKGSDIDLTIIGKLSWKEFTQLENELDDLLLPYQIDLSLFNQIDDISIIDHINRVGKKFYP
jgi:predicted nucleotidyltransferase